MKPNTRRTFLTGSAAAIAAAAPATAQTNPNAPLTREVSLDGLWRFRTDAETASREVTVPHTWQVEPALCEHYGVSWYEREFDAPAEWSSSAVRIEFEAVFHSATVWVNGTQAGEHLRKGYTAFTLDIARHLRFGARNTLRVRVDNAFNEDMLPRGRSSDWAHDGGIVRPVRLLVTPQVFIEHLEIEAQPSRVAIRAIARNAGISMAEGSVACEIVDETSGLVVWSSSRAATYRIPAGGSAPIPLTAATIAEPRLWHFDHPHLYRATVRLASGHEHADTFGIRTIETRDGRFFLNGEPVRLMGVERMAGSNPTFGMAEPATWIQHDHADMLGLNCVYTRVHWPQDRRVLDYCDRNGILIQTEVPTWGPRTFAGMRDVPSEVILNNGLEQLREMIARDRNHPCIFSWGVCNEINGQNPPAAGFARALYREAKRLDPSRLVTYASNSLQKTPEKDVAGEMDYVMWNEYYESWMPGTPADLARNLDEIHRAFPGKAIVISEYGYCACTADRPEGDTRRTEILRVHDAIFRERPWVAGLIFFCYNDYRTHVGDKGTGALKQRVHGVVDLYGARKPSWEELRRESSPVEAIVIAGSPTKLRVTLRTRATVPAYLLRGYQLRAVAHGYGDIPLECITKPVPELAPGGTTEIVLTFAGAQPQHITIDVLRPTGFSAITQRWTA